MGKPFNDDEMKALQSARHIEAFDNNVANAAKLLVIPPKDLSVKDREAFFKDVTSAFAQGNVIIENNKEDGVVYLSNNKLVPMKDIISQIHAERKKTGNDESDISPEAVSDFVKNKGYEVAPRIVLEIKGDDGKRRANDVLDVFDEERSKQSSTSKNPMEAALAQFQKESDFVSAHNPAVTNKMPSTGQSLG